MAAEYKEVPYRFVNLIIYVLAAIVNSLPVHTFSSINTSVQEAFDYSKQIVTANALLFTILHPIGAFPANWILDKYGSRVGCVIGSVFVVAGVWVRTILERNEPFYCLIGSFLAAFGNLFVLNSAVKVAVNWFTPANIPTIIFLTVLANQISATLGAALPGLILPKSPSAEQIKNLVFIEAIVITVPLLLLIIFYKQKPQIPPSKSAANPGKKQDYKVLLKKLFSNKQYIKILLGMMFSYGTIIAFIATLDPILKSLKYSDSNQITALTILFSMLIGTLATPVFSTLIKNTKKYKLVTSLNIIGCYVFLGIMIYIYTLRVETEWIISLFAGLAGFFLIPNVSLYLAYSAEVSFPIGEGSAGGYLFAAAQTFGAILGGIVITIIDENNPLPSQICLVMFELFTIISLLCIFMTKEDLRRQKFQQHRRSSIKNSGDGTITQDDLLGSGNLEDSLIIHR